MRDIRALVTSRPWVVLPIESNVRELHARILLAAVASELGLGVVIGRAAELPRYLPTLPQAVLLYMSAVFPDVFSLARRNRHTPTVIDEEGLIYRNEADYLRRRIALSSLEQCERFFAWGAVHRRVVASVAPHLADRILPVGNPRIDLLRPSLREIHRPEAEALTRDHGRFILVNTNLGTFNHQLGPEARVREWAARGWSDSEEGAELLRRTVDYQHRMFDEFARLIEALADGLPKDVAVVVRPHPSERLAS